MSNIDPINAKTVNGHTVEADVPADANFNDTTYDMTVKTVYSVDTEYTFANLKILPAAKLAILNYTRKIAITNGSLALEIPAEYAPPNGIYTYAYYKQSKGYGLVKMIINKSGQVVIKI